MTYCVFSLGLSMGNPSLPLVQWLVCGHLCSERGQVKGGLEATEVMDGKRGQGWRIWKARSTSEAASHICIYVYVVHIYLIFLSPPSPFQAADFDMCPIVWFRICRLCLHLLCGLLFEVSLVASESWLCHHPICHLEGAHFCKHCRPIHTIMPLLTLLGGLLLL